MDAELADTGERQYGLSERGSAFFGDLKRNVRCLCLGLLDLEAFLFMGLRVFVDSAPLFGLLEFEVYRVVLLNSCPNSWFRSIIQYVACPFSEHMMYDE